MQYKYVFAGGVIRWKLHIWNIFTNGENVFDLVIHSDVSVCFAMDGQDGVAVYLCSSHTYNLAELHTESRVYLSLWYVYHQASAVVTHYLMNWSILGETRKGT